MDYYLLRVRSSKETAMFATTADYKRCLLMLACLKNEYQFDIRGFCLMPDYLKLVISLDHCEINKELAVLNKDDQLFAWKKILSIFPKAMPVKGQCIRIADRRRLADVLKYIEYEPVRAGIVNTAREYQYCSAYSYLSNPGGVRVLNLQKE